MVIKNHLTSPIRMSVECFFNIQTPVAKLMISLNWWKKLMMLRCVKSHVDFKNVFNLGHRPASQWERWLMTCCSETLDLKNQVQTLAMIIARMLLGEQIPNLPSTILWKPWKPYITLFFNHEHQQSLTVWPLQVTSM